MLIVLSIVCRGNEKAMAYSYSTCMRSISSGSTMHRNVLQLSIKSRTPKCTA